MKYIIPHGSDYLVVSEKSRRFDDNRVLYNIGTFESCKEWCDAHDFDYIVVRSGSFVPSSYFSDVAKRCDVKLAAVIESVYSNGLTFVHDCTYRASASWKDDSVHYTYFGDLGAHVYVSFKSDTPPDVVYAVNNVLAELFGYSRCLWELGFQLTFDSSYRHSVLNCRESLFADFGEVY